MSRWICFVFTTGLSKFTRLMFQYINVISETIEFIVKFYPASIIYESRHKCLIMVKHVYLNVYVENISLCIDINIFYSLNWYMHLPKNSSFKQYNLVLQETEFEFFSLSLLTNFIVESTSPDKKIKILKILAPNHCILKFNWNTNYWKSESVQEHFLASWNCVSYFARCLNAATNVLSSSSLHQQLSLQQWKIISLPPSTVALWSISLVSPLSPPRVIPPSISTYWEKRI